MAYKQKGAKVCWTKKTTKKGKGMTYRSGCGVLLEGANVGPNAGWDVVDVRSNKGRTRSVYSFSLYTRKHKRK